MRFSGFEFDTRARKLRRRGIRLRVPDQSLEILALLLRQPGEIVTRDEIRRCLWPNGTIVEFEHSVNSAVQRLREALSDSAAKPRFIETVAKRGYRFIGEVEPETPAIPHYRIVEEIGRGAMGVVYRAEDSRLGRNVALKLLPAHATDEPELRERFVREAQAAAAVQHPNIATVFEFDEQRGFLAMELIDGPSLRDRIRQRTLQLSEVIRIASEVGEGLRSAHERGVVHRDINSSNILLTSTGQVKITDFGLAMLAGRTRLTRAGEVVGTPAYMSPEQARGEMADARSDIWSLGVVMYEMITGQLPFGGETAASVMFAILNREPEPVTSVRSGVPPDLERVVAKAMTKDPAERYQHIADMLADLRSVQTRAESCATETTAPKPDTNATERAAMQAERIRSLAILPFSDMSPAKDQQYFCDGLAEELITSLAKIRELHVAARTSTFAFKDTAADIREIGRKLNVQAVVEGSVRKEGQKLRISVQLISVADGYPIWTERYDRDAVEIFAVQDQVVAAIIEQLRLTLLPEERRGVFARRTNNLQAHRAYLKGLDYLWVFSRPGFPEAIPCFEEALRLDPNYAQAYFGLSEAYLKVAFWGNIPPRQACQKVKLYAQRALALDPTLGDAHGALSYVHLIYDWDCKAAEREALEGIRLSPNSWMVRAYYSWFLLHTGRGIEAIREALKAQALDPVSSVAAFAVGLAFSMSGDFPRGIEEYRAGLQVNANFYILHEFLGMTCFANREYPESILAHERATNLSDRLPWFVANLAQTLTQSGRESEAAALWRELEDRAQQEYVRPCCFLLMHAGLGNFRPMLRWLKKAGEEHDSYLSWMRLLPVEFIQGRNESRIKARLKKAFLNVAIRRTLQRNRIVSAT